jgi:hypothetical protein
MAERNQQTREDLLRALIAGGQDGGVDPAALQALLRQPGGILGGGLNAAQIVAGLKDKLQASSPALSRAAGAGAAAMAGVEPNPMGPGRDRREDDRPGGILSTPAPKPKPTDSKPPALPTAQPTAPAPAPKPQGILAMGPSQGPDPGTVRVPNVPDVPTSVNRSVARGDVADRIRSWTGFLMKPVDQGGLGRTREQAQGEVASLLGESGGLNPNLSHDHGTGYGTAAWRDPKPGVGRKTNLINFTKANGLDYTTVEGQQAFYRHEMLGDYKAVNDQIARAKTPQEALRAHVYEFERPLDKPGQARDRAKHFGTVASAMGGATEVATGADSMGRGATTGKGLAPDLKPPPAPTQKAAPQMTGILGGPGQNAPLPPPRPADIGPGAPAATGILPVPQGDAQAPTAPTVPDFMDSGGRQIKGLVLHHTATDPQGRVPQTVDDLKAMYAQNHLSGAHLFVDRQGNISQTLDFGQAGQHTRPGEGPGAGFGNRNTIGVEVAAKNDADITPEQRSAVTRLWPALQERYPGIQPLAHGQINPGHKEATEGATLLGDIRSLGKTLPGPGEDVPLPPARHTDIGTATPDVTTTGSTSTPTPNVPTTEAELGPNLDADSGGIPDVSAFIPPDAPAPAPTPAPTPEPEAEKDQSSEMLASPSLLQGGGILSQPNADLGRVFSPEGFGGSGLLGRDQAPETTGFKAPVGLPQGGQVVGQTGILGGDAGPSLADRFSGILSTPAQSAPSAGGWAGIADIPLPPRRPDGLGLPDGASGILASPPIAPPQLAPPEITPPAPAQTSPLITRRQDLPGFGTPDGQGRTFDTPNVGARPSLGALATPMPSPATPRPADALNPPLPPARPSGILGDPTPAPTPAAPQLGGILAPPQPGPQLGAVASPPPLDPDRFARDAAPSAPLTVNAPGLQASARATATSLAGSAAPGQQPDISRLMGILGGGFSGTSGGLGDASGETAAQRKRRAATSAQSSSPDLQQGSLLQRGILAGARGGIDFNRFFGILGGRAR